ncbi:hypothetical protein THRCLA_20423 [Thraustotheca clavata]|uniref:Uncharacterized protein n=1 Tax=Thraustotheca clavata TaxID=74557 RepID=A0A1W0A7G5_9STRA|nr:hypothetical protein THRCLA_20423 [Thraustotheca clavata]
MDAAVKHEKLDVILNKLVCITAFVALSSSVSIYHVSGGKAAGGLSLAGILISIGDNVITPGNWLIKAANAVAVLVGAIWVTAAAKYVPNSAAPHVCAVFLFLATFFQLIAVYRSVSRLSCKGDQDPVKNKQQMEALLIFELPIEAVYAVAFTAVTIYECAAGTKNSYIYTSFIIVAVLQLFCVVWKKSELNACRDFLSEYALMEDP